MHAALGSIPQTVKKKKSLESFVKMTTSRASKMAEQVKLPTAKSNALISMPLLTGWEERASFHPLTSTCVYCGTLMFPSPPYPNKKKNNFWSGLGLNSGEGSPAVWRSFLGSLSSTEALLSGVPSSTDQRGSP